MAFKILRAVTRRSEASNENHPDGPRSTQPDLRDLATGAALAVALDASPAVLVTLQDYAQSFRPRVRRTA
jgi:hypothetical protein